MKVKHQILVAIVLLVLLFTWAFFQLLLPWLQRTASDPELESRVLVGAPPLDDLVVAMTALDSADGRDHAG